MKTNLSIILGILLLTQNTTKAQEYQWQGLYGGVHFNQSWGVNQDRLSGYEVISSGQSTSQRWTTDSPDLKGSGIGVHLGYHFLAQNLLSGIEARFSTSDQSGSEATTAGGSLNGSFNNIVTHARIHYSANLLAKLGTLISPQQSIYALAGVSAAKVKTNFDYTPGLRANYETHQSSDDTEYGWSIGAGTEYKLNASLSLRAEALYTDLGQSKRLRGIETLAPGGTPNPGLAEAINGKVDLKYTTLQFGLNYAF